MTMKTNLKKSLAIAGVLAAMMAGSAFAATTSDKDNLPPPPPPGAFQKGHGPQQLPKLTGLQRERLDAKRKELFANWQNMTPEQRRTAHNEFQKAVRDEQMKNMTPEEQEKFQKEIAKRDKERAEFKAKWAKMTPAQKEAYRTKQHEKMLKERTKGMTSEQKEAFLKRDAQIQKERAEFREKWQKMTPAEKEQWRKDHPRKEGMGPMQMKGYGNDKFRQHHPMGPGPALPPPAEGESK
jgi:hypothetical protein